MRPRVLVVEHDPAFRDALLRGPAEEEFAPVGARDGAAALRLADAAADTVHAAVLGVRLPDAHGRDVCRAMRANGLRCPVIFLTAHDRLADRLAGFAAGGDDYLPKPCHLAELAARLRAALRRRGEPLPRAAAGDLRLDAARHAVAAGEVRTALTPTEFRLLAPLMATPGELVRRRDLIRAGWPEGARVSDNTLDQYLSRLRRKLRRTGSALTVTTARGVGHRLALPDRDAALTRAPVPDIPAPKAPDLNAS
ncbi:response regulator transcription factor [Streptomyces sp. ODS28]|uniref:response regulator transcription factor n=1 Tax=Streptomyces sp. ODS28 TaxID=3136688 RepID=UPI0031E9D7AE